ncbi:MAG: hypothetical protein JW860_09475 [Sedimentisphaerales bacterium]|nr:hypothetical protein [Sedimentisphaerales bacterium]
MAILFECPHCNKSLEARDEAAGKTGKCPSCGKDIKVPEKTSADTAK